MSCGRMVLATAAMREEVLWNITDADLASFADLRGVETRAELVACMRSDAVQELLFTFAFVVERRPLAFVGFSQATAPGGVLEAWAVATRALGPAHALSYTREGKRLCDGLLRSGKCRRLFAYSQVGHPTSARWLRALGFTEEGLMRRFGQTSDWRLFGRVTA